ncbi:hypothetical protein CEXT_548611 [Caerostris extrusa]|uniref:Uncharacterized protein n=1 Tax=Caerostris extrusa TaxID=172846 RepID=A0AAV4XPB1_CAEEX|nr:hypothetical protein CEXT_548611 [Caerostris extrusa]
MEKSPDKLSQKLAVTIPVIWELSLKRDRLGLFDCYKVLTLKATYGDGFTAFRALASLFARSYPLEEEKKPFEGLYDFY